MAEKKNTDFDRPGGYAQPKGSTHINRKMARAMTEAEIKLYGDSVPPFSEPGARTARTAVVPDYRAADPDTQLYIGDCREILANLPERGAVDLIFADPPFNWEVPYAGGTRDGFTTERTENTEKKRDREHKSSPSVNSVISVVNSKKGGAGGGGWNDAMPRAEYERFTFDWLDGCIECLAPHGSIFVNVPDDIAAEVVLHLKRRGLTMINWCIWHFRFGQNRNSSFIMSKVHVLYFAKFGLKNFTTEVTENTESESRKTRKSLSVNSASSVVKQNDNGCDRIWNSDEILELSDRASIYADPRTMNKENNKGLRVPMDVWYGKYWGRIQGNNKERRHNHHNQIPEIYLERVIRCASNPGSLVLDPFCGSGTTSTVARALGRRSITIEYSPVNAKSAWERIIDVGMIPREDAGKPQSTAIFDSRRKRKVPLSA